MRGQREKENGNKKKMTFLILNTFLDLKNLFQSKNHIYQNTFILIQIVFYVFYFHLYIIKSF